MSKQHTRKIVIDNETYHWKFGCSKCVNCLCVTMPDNKVIRLSPEAVTKATGFETWLVAQSPGRVRFAIDRMIISAKKKELGLPRNKSIKHRDDPLIGKLYSIKAEHPDNPSFSNSLVQFWESQSNNLVGQVILIVDIDRSNPERSEYHYCSTEGKVGCISMLPNVKWKNLFRRVVW